MQIVGRVMLFFTLLSAGVGAAWPQAPIEATPAGAGADYDAGSPSPAPLPGPVPAAEPNHDGVSKLTESDVFRKQNAQDQFNSLKNYRNIIVFKINDISNKLNNHIEKLRSLEENRKSSAFLLYSSFPTQGQIKAMLDRATKDVEALRKELETPALTDSLRDKLKNDLDDKERDRDNAQQSLDNYETNRQQFDTQRADQENKNKGLDHDIAYLSSSIDSAKSEINGLYRDLQDVDDRIAGLLTQNDALNEFKKIMSEVFAGLVAVVIVGFFIIAFRDENVRKAIFSNESGIQFITLFSLVIAIILFGIVGILEGKELAALLGGLSGYILGRGTPKTA